jgi:hypothetical protein
VRLVDDLTPSDARVGLLSELIDHAPMFPPAQLGVIEARSADALARGSAASFMLGRLVWRMSLIDELGGVDRGLSVVLDAPFVPDSRIESVEVRRTEDFEALVDLAPEVYVELPIDDLLEERIARLANLGLRAKVRCGGEAVPSVADLARFIRTCRASGVVLKATAGLHHAVRSGVDHGFLNLLAAAVFGAEEEALAETDPAAFTLDGDAFGWRDRRSDHANLEHARQRVFRSIGSCSFFEPVEELQVLGMLPR